MLALLGGLALLMCGCGAASIATKRPRATGLQSMFEAQTQLLSAPAATLDQLRRLGVDTVRVFVPWGSLAPNTASHVAPAHLDPSSPSAYPAAGWQPFDTIAREAAARGMRVFLTLEGPPPLWASGGGAPRGGSYPQWEPSASDYGAFVRAVGTRYSGSYRPPGSPSPLPRVSFWSIWNEPNYGPQLAPQAIDNSTVEVSPRLYRALLDAAWASLRATGHGSDTILIGELAPRGITTGNNPGNFSGMVPLRFLRALYCVDSSYRQLRGAAATARGCPSDASSSAGFAAANPALFRATGFAAHLYPQGGLPPNFVIPDEPDYADLASLPRLESTLDRAISAYGFATRLPIYSTEFGFQTNPPEKIIKTTNPATAAYYLNLAEYISWRDPRIRSWDQFQLTDPRSGSFASGLEFADGRPKPSFFAYRLPIFLPVTSANRGQGVELWGCVRPARNARPATQRTRSVRIQFQTAGAGPFRTIRTLPLTGPDGYFDLRMKFASSGSVRLAWSYPDGSTIYSRTATITIR